MAYHDGYQSTVTVTQAPADASGTHFYAADQVGTTQLELNSAGLPLWRGEFTPFGQELSNPTLTTNRYKFTGKERDAESGLDYFGARFYASNLGRWMSADWADKPEAVPYSDLNDPQSLNLYGYVRNNPLSHADADGHDWPSLGEVKDFSIGMLKGTVGSLTGGAYGSRPSMSDSAASLNGQMLGSAGVTAAGIMADAQGLAAVAGGELLAGPSGGATLTVSGAGAVEIAAGTAMISGGTSNAAQVVAMGQGSYTNTHESGKTYHGKGDSTRAKDPGRR